TAHAEDIQTSEKRRRSTTRSDKRPPAQDTGRLRRSESDHAADGHWIGGQAGGGEPRGISVARAENIGRYAESRQLVGQVQHGYDRATAPVCVLHGGFSATQYGSDQSTAAVPA